MKIILVRDKGTTRSIWLSRRRAVAGILAGVMGLALAGVWIHTEASRQVVDNEVIAAWQARLSAQEAEVEAVQAKARAESQAVGRQLAQMQARLMRMEALGARVTEVADLEAGEFNFSEPAAQGGPSDAREEPMAWFELNARIDALSRSLRTREDELEILESLLTDQEYQQGTALGGRPIKWGWMSSPYGYRVDPISGQRSWHAGVDFAGKEGSDVIAVASGVVTFAGQRSGYGKIVEISHGGGVITRYAHHAELLVSTGDIVKKGQIVGRMGSSGRATGPHVHFEVEKGGKSEDPAKYLARKRV